MNAEVASVPMDHVQSKDRRLHSDFADGDYTINLRKNRSEVNKLPCNYIMLYLTRKVSTSDTNVKL